MESANESKIYIGAAEMRIALIEEVNAKGHQHRERLAKGNVHMLKC